MSSLTLILLMWRRHLVPPAEIIHLCLLLHCNVPANDQTRNKILLFSLCLILRQVKIQWTIQVDKVQGRNFISSYSCPRRSGNQYHNRQVFQEADYKQVSPNKGMYPLRLTTQCEPIRKLRSLKEFDRRHFKNK